MLLYQNVKKMKNVDLQKENDVDKLKEKNSEPMLARIDEKHWLRSASARSHS